MIDLGREHVVTITDAPNHYPKRDGRKTHKSTVYRHVYQGIKGIRLESFLAGGVRYTSLEANSRFFAETTEASDKARRESARKGRLSAEREHEVSLAAAELDASGI